MKNEQENNKEIKKYQPEAPAESSTTAIQRKQTETQIVKKFDALLNLVPTDEQLTGDEKVRKYFSDKEEERKKEAEENERQKQRRKEEDEKLEEIKEKEPGILRKGKFLLSPLLSLPKEEEENWKSPLSEWNEWMGPERLKEREEWTKKNLLKTAEKAAEGFASLFADTILKAKLSTEKKSHELELTKIKATIGDENQNEVRKFTSTAKNELQTIKNQFSDFVKAQNEVIVAIEGKLEKERISKEKLKQQGEAKIRDYEEQGQKITEKLVETEKAEKKEREKIVEISKKLEAEKNSLSDLAKEKDRLTSENQGLNEKLTNFKNKEQEWEAQKQEIEQLINKKEQEVKELQEKLFLSEKEVQNYADKAAEVSERLKKNRTLPDPAKISHEELKKEYKNLESQHQEQTLLIEAGKVEISNKNERINYLNNGIESLKNEVTNWEQKISAKRGEICELEKKINGVKTAMTEQEERIKELKGKISLLEQQKKTLESEIERLRKKWEAEIEETAKEKIKLNNSLITKQGEYDRLELGKNDEIRDLENIISGKELLLTQNAENMLTWINRHEKAEAEKKEFEDKFIDADEANKEKQRTIDDLTKEKQQLENNISQIETKKNELQNELSQTKEILTKEKRMKRLGNLFAVGVWASDYLPLPKKWNGAIKMGFETAQAWQIVSDLPNSTYEIIIGLTGIMAFFVVRSLWRRIFGRKEINKIAELQGELTEMRTKILVEKLTAKNEEPKSEVEPVEPKTAKRKKKIAAVVEVEAEPEAENEKDGETDQEKETEK